MSMTERIEEFTHDGRQFLYFDLSHLKNNDEYMQLIEAAKPLVSKHARNSVYTITNVEGLRFDTETKKIVAKWIEHNKPYVIHGAVIGVDGIKKIIIASITAITGRKNLTFAANKEHAIEQCTVYSVQCTNKDNS